MTSIDCSLFIKGEENIDRKKHEIDKVLKTITNLLNSKKHEKKWKSGKIMFEMQIGNYFFQIKDCGGFKYCDFLYRDKSDTCWWARLDVNDFPASVVPMVHKNLSNIVENIDDKLPEFGIKKHFQFFIDQAN